MHAFTSAVFPIHKNYKCSLSQAIKSYRNRQGMVDPSPCSAPSPYTHTTDKSLNHINLLHPK